MDANESTSKGEKGERQAIAKQEKIRKNEKKKKTFTYLGFTEEGIKVAHDPVDPLKLPFFPQWLWLE